MGHCAFSAWVAWGGGDWLSLFWGEGISLRCGVWEVTWSLGMAWGGGYNYQRESSKRVVGFLFLGRWERWTVVVEGKPIVSL